MEARVTIKLPESLRRQAKAVAALRGETIAEVLRARLEEYVQEAQADDNAAWKELTAQQFLAGYADSDAVYDTL